jgi:hypothetical protein
MIDRKALWIFIAAFLAMTGVSIWQLTLLPDWPHTPLGGPDSHPVVRCLLVFIAPVSLLSVMLTPFIQWLTTPREALPSWRHWSGKWIISWTVFWVVFQAFTLAHSQGFVSLSNLDTARSGSVMIGIIFMIVGNITPKTPSLPQRNSSQLDAWRLNRMYRFIGKLLVGLGLAFVLGGILLPLEYWQPVFLCLMLAALTAGIWHGVKVRHERSVATAHARSSRANI